MRRLWNELCRRSRVLALAGALQFAALAVVILAAPFDGRTILGINPWIKPMKFLVSVGIYVWTVAWYLDYLRGPRWAKAALAWGVAAVMIVENTCILMQSARGVRSHFNFETAFDGSVFAVMGIGILLNTVLLAGLASWLFAAPRRGLPVAYLWALRLGTLLILAGSAEGVMMLDRGAHTVGAADGGPGLPFVNWSTEAGDLRIAHAIGLHGFQAFPLFAWLLARWLPRLGEAARTTAVLAFAAAWLAAGLFFLLQALAGRPLL